MFCSVSDLNNVKAENSHHKLEKVIYERSPKTHFRILAVWRIYAMLTHLTERSTALGRHFVPVFAFSRPGHECVRSRAKPCFFYSQKFVTLLAVLF